jgi:hypothetical protein
MATRAPREKRDDGTPPKGPGSPERFHGKKRGPAKFKLRETTRIVSGAKRGGASAVEVLPDGRIRILFGEPPPTTSTDAFAEWEAKKNARQA